MVNGVSQKVNSLMGAAGTPTHGEGSGPAALAVPSGAGERGQSGLAAVRVLFNNT